MLSREFIVILPSQVIERLAVQKIYLLQKQFIQSLKKHNIIIVQIFPLKAYSTIKMLHKKICSFVHHGNHTIINENDVLIL